MAGRLRHRIGRPSAGSLLLFSLVLLQCSSPLVLAFRSSIQTSRISEATSAPHAESSSTLDELQRPRPKVHSPFNSEASLQVAARQRLFDYAVGQGLDILDLAVKKINIPEYKTTIEVPVIGGIDVTVSNVNISRLQVPRELAKVAIESGYYHLKAENLTAQTTFNWAWSKGPLSGSGYGELSLDGGSLDEIFLVRNQEAGVPQLVAVSSAVGFGALNLDIHSYSADWLYQAMLFIFSGTIKSQIETALDSAVHTDVPAAINGLLDSLPAKVSVQGLPFDVVFTYAVYTLNYVVVKGYGEVAVVPDPSVADSIADSIADSSRSRSQQQTSPQQIQQAACPFPSGELPLTPAEIGGDANMFSFYIHEAIPNCILWGLYNAGALHQTIQDGNIPQLRLITDLFGGLIPELPKHYPKKGMLMDIRMREAPTVEFKAGSDGSVVISARYDTNVSVLNATGDGSTALVAQLTANVSIAADFGWTQTVIHGTTVNYDVLSQVFPVNVNGWNQIIDWVVKQAGPKQSLGQLWDSYVKTPATPYVGLDNVVTHAVDSWFIISSDVKVKQLPPVV